MEKALLGQFIIISIIMIIIIGCIICFGKMEETFISLKKIKNLTLCFFFNMFFRCVVVVCFLQPCLLHKFSRRKRGGGERERRMNKGHNGPTPMTSAPSTGCPL
jgi:hypothetical protein